MAGSKGGVSNWVEKYTLGLAGVNWKVSVLVAGDKLILAVAGFVYRIRHLWDFFFGVGGSSAATIA